MLRLGIVFALIGLLNACSFGVPIGSPKDTTASNNKSNTPYKKPTSYVVFGKHYNVLSSSDGYVKRGIASWYGSKFHGRKTANGETYDMFAMTAAHKTLPLPTQVSVKNLATGKSIIVRVNDRGPFVGDRIIDLSYAAAKELDILTKGTERVEVRVLNQTNTSPSVRIIPLNDNNLVASDFFIQVGSFGLKQNALTIQQQLKEQNFDDINIYPIETTQGHFFRVRLGPYTLLEKANRVLHELKSKHFNQARLIVEN